MKINNVSAGYSPFCDVERENNGGEYWHYYGTCTVEIDDGTILSAEYENKSCGDLGERWYIEFITEDGDVFRFADDSNGTYDDMNVKMCDLMFARFGVYSSSLIYQVSYAVSKAALDKYIADSEDE